jgi:hypothetical protein
VLEAIVAERRSVASDPLRQDLFMINIDQTRGVHNSMVRYACDKQIEGAPPMSIFMILFVVLLVAWLHFVRGRTTSA